LAAHPESLDYGATALSGAPTEPDYGAGAALSGANYSAAAADPYGGYVALGGAPTQGGACDYGGGAALGGAPMLRRLAGHRLRLITAAMPRSQRVFRQM
jgi:hypothetical protein